ncbi:MAG: ATP-binding cassette domain-containing protein [Pseudomonadota bacterium]
MADTSPIFECKDLKIEARPWDADPIPIVKGVTFDVKPGQVVALIGESGSGKTTISLASLGYTKPGLFFSGGQANLLGKDMITIDPEERRLRRGEHVAYLAQSAAATFNPALKIGEQVTESAVLHGAMTQEQANKRARELYEALELPDPDRIGGRYPHQVSGGQLQRLMAAMALVEKPSLLVLDEPTTALDVTTQIEVLKAFKKVIEEEGSAAIYVTHDLAVVAQIADHIVVLYGGEIMEQGPVEQIINRPTHSYTRRLMAAVRPTPTAGMGEGTSGEHRREVPALEARRVTAGYGRGPDGKPLVTILKNISLPVERGHVVGVIGESGCGKSTLARVMAGLLPASEGDVLLDGAELKPDLADRSRDELRLVQFVFQMADTALNPRQTIGDIIGRPLTFYHNLSGRARRERIHEILKLVELPPEFEGRYPAELSGGQKQRVNLARALAANPEVIICDEVTSALDTIVGANIIKLLRRLRDQLGVSYVFISHDLSTVASFADEIAVLYNGELVDFGTVDEVLTPPFHPYTELLITSVPEMRVGWLDDTAEQQQALAANFKAGDYTASSPKVMSSLATNGSGASKGTAAKPAASSKAGAGKATAAKATGRGAKKAAQPATARKTTTSTRAKTGSGGTATKAKASSAGRTAAAKKPAASKKPAARKAPAKKAAPDDLQQISGVGPKIAGQLKTMGITTFDQIASWKKAEMESFNEQLKFKGRIEREQWVPQAKKLAKAKK